MNLLVSIREILIKSQQTIRIRIFKKRFIIFIFMLFLNTTSLLLVLLIYVVNNRMNYKFI